MQEITFPVRVMKELGVKYLLISNACGALNLDFKKGSLMLIDDHINLLGDGPLIGPNHNNLGPRFPDMSQPYSALLNSKLKNIAKKENIKLPEGVYVAVAGPTLKLVRNTVSYEVLVLMLWACRLFLKPSLPIMLDYRVRLFL